MERDNCVCSAILEELIDEVIEAKTVYSDFFANSPLLDPAPATSLSPILFANQKLHDEVKELIRFVPSKLSQPSKVRPIKFVVSVFVRFPYSPREDC